MNYHQLNLKILNVKWKTFKCEEENCQYLGIVPIDKITDDNGEDIYIIDCGSLSKEYAEYFIKLHNDIIDKKIFFATKKVKGF
jgi:hypothetical protein